MPGFHYAPRSDTAAPAVVSSAYAYALSLVAAISGLLFGFDIAVINGAILFLRRQFQLSEIQTEFAASALLIGCVVGASVAGVLSDRYGRRWILILSAILFAVSSLGAALPRTLAEFTVARFLGGIAIGVASVLAPVYIAEISPPRIRGRLVSLNQMAIVSGILLAYLVNWLLASLGESSWRWMFASAAVPSVGFLLALLFVPESPRWLVEREQEPEALRILTRVGGAEHAAREIVEIRESIAQESGSVLELFRPGLRKALLIAVVMAVLQQITGINTVLFYGSIIFKEHAGNADAAAIAANVMVGITNVLATIVALWLIDKVGRKALLIVSALGMCLAEIALGVAFRIEPVPTNLILGIVLFCTGSFAVGMGPGVWVLMSELFPTRIRGSAMSIATVSLWCACVALTFTFLSLVKAITVSGAFWLYATMCLATVVFVWRVTPETKGKSLEEIEKLWRR